MNLGLESIVLEKPVPYDVMDLGSAESYLKILQGWLTMIKVGIVDKGEEQLKAMTGYDGEHIPDESPVRLDYSTQGFDFSLITNVKVVNPPYQSICDKINGFLEVVVNDWRQGVRKDGVRTYDKEVFVEWNYLMRNVLGYSSRSSRLGVENKFEKIIAPSEVDELSVDRLAVPLDLWGDFNVEKPGAVKIWYLARKFYEEVMEETVKPFKATLVENAKDVEAPIESKKYSEQIEKYGFVVQRVVSPRRQPGKLFSLLYAIPQKGKKRGSTSLPVIPGPDNYVQLLEDYRSELPKSLKKWKKFDGKIGELVVFYYGIEGDERVQDEFKFLPEYAVKRDGDKMFVSVQALYDRMVALEKNYKVNRVLNRHSSVPIV